MAIYFVAIISLLFSKNKWQQEQHLGDLCDKEMWCSALCHSEEELKEVENHNHMYLLLLPVCSEGQGTVQKPSRHLDLFN